MLSFSLLYVLSCLKRSLVKKGKKMYFLELTDAFHRRLIYLSPFDFQSGCIITICCCGGTWVFMYEKKYVYHLEINK